MARGGRRRSGGGGSKPTSPQGVKKGAAKPAQKGQQAPKGKAGKAKREKPPTREELDDALDAYFLKDKKRAGGVLDAQMDAYMAKKEEALAAAPADGEAKADEPAPVTKEAVGELADELAAANA